MPMILFAVLLAWTAPPQQDRSAASRPAADPAALVLALSSPDRNARDAAVERLREIGKPAIPVLRGALDAPEAEARRFAAMLLGEFGAKEAAPRLKRALGSDPEERVRAEAAYALGRIRADGCGEALVEVFRIESSPRVLRAALATLGEIRDPRTFEPVLAFAEKTEDAYLRSVAGRALADLTGQRFRADFAAWRAWWEKYGPKFLEACRERTEASPKGGARRETPR